MEHKTPSIKPIAYTYGLYSALLSITGLIIMYVANMDKNWTLSIISLVISVLIFVYGIKAFKNANANVLSIGQTKEFIEMQRETAYNQMMESNPNMTEEQVDQAMGISNIFMNSTFFSLSSILGSLIFGLIVSLIAGLIMRSDH